MVSVRYLGFTALIGLASLLAPSPVCGDDAGISLRVVDEAGAPVSKFEVLVVHDSDRQPPKWTEGSNGRVTVDGSVGTQPLDVVVRGDGFASSVRRFAEEELKRLASGEATILLERGSNVSIEFAIPPGRQWPERLVPAAYIQSHQRMIPWARPLIGPKVPRAALDMNELGATATAPNATSVRLAASSPSFLIGIDAPGFLRFCEVGPFSAGDVQDGVLKVTLPAPVSLRVALDPGTTPADDLPYVGSDFSVMLKPSGAGTTTAVADVLGQGQQAEFVLRDMPAGEYHVNLTTKPKAAGTRTIFRDSKRITVPEGKDEELVFRFVPLDPNVFRGDRTALVKILRNDGSVAAGMPVKISLNDIHYTRVPVFSGEVPESGVLELSGLRDIYPGGKTPLMYLVETGAETIGAFRLTSAAGTKEFSFRLAPALGEIAPDVELTNVSTGGKLTLSELRGKIVYIDFWATWCGPCQEPMLHMDQLAAAKADAWKDRVALVPISTDEKIETVLGHVDLKGWTHLDHYWSGGKRDGTDESPAAKAYVVEGIPDAYLLDRAGRVLWHGHPSATNGPTIEERIEAALAED